MRQKAALVLHVTVVFIFVKKIFRLLSGALRKRDNIDFSLLLCLNELKNEKSLNSVSIPVLSGLVQIKVSFSWDLLSKAPEFSICFPLIKEE